MRNGWQMEDFGFKTLASGKIEDDAASGAGNTIIKQADNQGADSLGNDSSGESNSSSSSSGYAGQGSESSSGSGQVETVGTSQYEETVIKHLDALTAASAVLVIALFWVIGMIAVSTLVRSFENV